MGGNIGTPILALEPPAANRFHVIECSSFQIDLAPSLAPCDRRAPQHHARPSRPARHDGELRGDQGEAGGEGRAARSSASTTRYSLAIFGRLRKRRERASRPFRSDSPVLAEAAGPIGFRLTRTPRSSRSCATHACGSARACSATSPASARCAAVTTPRTPRLRCRVSPTTFEAGSRLATRDRARRSTTFPGLPSPPRGGRPPRACDLHQRLQGHQRRFRPRRRSSPSRTASSGSSAARRRRAASKAFGRSSGGSRRPI